MKTYYFASFVETWDIGFFEVAVFEDKEARDKWVAFQDPASVRVGETEANCELHRMALDDDIDVELYYKMLDTCNREDDPENEKMFWLT